MNVAIVGASTNREKYSNKAVRAYVQAGHTVYPVNPHEDTIEGLTCYHSLSDITETIDEILIYVPSQVGLTLVDEIAKVQPKQLFLNPGAESPELVDALKAHGIEPILACSILAAGYKPSDF